MDHHGTHGLEAWRGSGVRQRRRGLSRIESRFRVIGLCPFLMALAACDGRNTESVLPSAETVSLRLVDLLPAAEMERGAEVEAPPRTEWRFDQLTFFQLEGEAGETGGWKAGGGVEELRIEEGRLIGRSTTDFPIIHAARVSDRKDQDLLYAVEITARVEKGSNIGVLFQSSEQANTEAARGPFNRMLTTPVLAEVGLRTYTIRATEARKASDIRQVLLRPTDAADARFEIAALRLIFLKEHLAEIPAGVGWHGLSDIYYEAVAARAPQSIRLKLLLPARPWLDLALGALESDPVTFKVQAAALGAPGGRAAPQTIFEHTVSTPERWDTARVDLGAFADREVELTFSLAAEKAGAIGFWGAPAVRNAWPAAKPTRLGARAESRRAPNVILVMADTLRLDHLDVYGYGRATAPTLRRLAAEGARFGDCIAQATWTKVSTPSILSSLYPSSHTVQNLPDRLPSSATTLAEAFREAGYATLSFSSVPFSGQQTNLHQGFEQLQESASVRGAKRSKTAREYVDRLIGWLDAHQDTPFFVFLHVFDPHDPYEPYAPYDVRWADPEAKERHRKDLEKVRPLIEDQFLRRLGLPARTELEKAEVDPEAFVGLYRDEYDGSIRAMDVEIGRLIQRLETLGLADDTVVAFVADHGEEFLDHGRSFHGHSIYGELTNVPLLFWGPGRVPPGVVVEETVQTIDVMPTLLDLAGLPAPEGLQGGSLRPLLAHGGDAAAAGWSARPAFAEKAAVTGRATPNGEWESYAIISGPWKLIHNVQRREGMPEFELFDHRRDPLNRDDLAEQKPEVVQELAEALRRWRETVLAERLPSDAEATAGASAEELARLRSLGYLQ